MSVNGTGVDPTKRIVVSKRIKALHRAAGNGLSLRAYVRALIAGLYDGNPTRTLAERWLALKGCAL